MSFKIINPTDESVVKSVDRLGVAETDEKITRGVRAQQIWARLSPNDRAIQLRRFADKVGEQQENLAQLETLNSGHPITQSRGEAIQVREVIEYYSASPERLSGQQIPAAGGMNVTFHEPMGVVGVITQWNFPIAIAAWGVDIALDASTDVIHVP